MSISFGRISKTFVICVAPPVKLKNVTKKKDNRYSHSITSTSKVAQLKFNTQKELVEPKTTDSRRRRKVKMREK